MHQIQLHIRKWYISIAQVGYLEVFKLLKLKSVRGSAPATYRQGGLRPEIGPNA